MAIDLEVLAVVQQVFAELGLGAQEVDEETAVPELSTRLLIAQRLEAATGQTLDDMDVYAATTVGELCALVELPTVGEEDEAGAEQPEEPDAEEGGRVTEGSERQTWPARGGAFEHVTLINVATRAEVAEGARLDVAVTARCVTARPAGRCNCGMYDLVWEGPAHS